MNWLRFIFITALLVVFVVTTIAAIFGSGKVLNALFRAYVFKVETCEYGPPKIARPLPAGKTEVQYEEPEKTCKIDYNRAKEDISDGLAMFLITMPLATLFFIRTRKYLYEKQSN